MSSKYIGDVAYYPLGNRILVKPIDTPKSSVIIIDTAKEKPLKGEIVSIGSGVKENLSIGDIVSFLKYSGADIELDEGKFLSLNMDEVLGKILPRA